MASDVIKQDFLGRGWSFPPCFDNQGRSVRMVDAEEDIQQSLQILLATRLGERVMQPEYGWERETLMFESMTTTFATQLKDEIETAILFYESRITVEIISIDLSSEIDGLIEIRIDYTIRTTNTRGNLVYPYYLDEGTNV